MEQASDETLTQPAVETPAQPAADAAPQAAPQAASPTPDTPAGETPIPAASETPAPAEPAPVDPEAAAPAAGAAPAPETPAAQPAAKQPVKRGGFKPRPASIETELARLLPLLYAEYDFEIVEGAPGARLINLWTLPAEAKTGAPVAEAPDKPNKWPPRTPVKDRKRDYQVHLYASTVKDPSWGVPGKDILAICANRGSGLLLMMADQKGYFLPSNRLGDLAELFSQSQASIYKITGTKLRKAAVARYFSLAGLVREVTAALAK